MSKTCDRCGKKLNERDRTTICLECEVALADEVKEQLEADNAALREKLEAEKKRADAAVEEICLKCHTRAAEFNLEVKSEHCAQCKWRDEQGTGPLANGGIVGNLDKKNGDTGDLGTSGGQEGAR